MEQWYFLVLWPASLPPGISSGGLSDPQDERIRPCLDNLCGHEAPEQPLEQLPLVVFRKVRQHAIQRCVPVVVADADIGATADEERRRLDAAKTGGEVERRLAGRVAGIDLLAVVKEDA